MKQDNALWSTMEDDRTWLDNPRRRKRRKGGKRKRSRSRGRKRARRNIGTVAPLFNRPRRRRKGGFVAKRKRGRRRFRRNPGFSLAGFSGGGIVRQLQQGVKDALYVKVGEIGAGFVSRFIPANLRGSGVVALIVDGIMAVVVGTVASKALGRDGARFVTAGALSAPMGTAIAMLTGGKLSAYAPLGMIPTLTRGPSFEGPRVSDNVLDGDAVMQGAY
jgi:hypothetical protein